MRWILLLPALLPVDAFAQDVVSRADPVLLEYDAGVMTVSMPSASDHLPGQWVGVYTAERRPDPRTREMREGLRFAGDGRVLWVGEDLTEIALKYPSQPLVAGARVVLGEPQSLEPTTVWRELEPEPAPSEVAVVVVPVPEVAALVADEPVVEGPDGPARTRREVATVNNPWRARFGRTQSVFTELDWSDDGYGTGVGSLQLGWAWVPKRRLGRVSVRLEGLRGARWVAADGGGKREPWAREPAVGYWIWSTIEGPAVALAPELGVAVGVEQSGPTGGFEVGLRSGLLHAGHVRLKLGIYGSMGYRWSLSGAVPLSDRLRLGTRARVGALPLHEQPVRLVTIDTGDEPWRQERADGTVRLTWDASSALTLTVGGGLAAYDLLFADAGPVLDTALELRW